MTGAVQSEAELNIFDAGPAVTLVESFGRVEYLPPDRAAARPKRGRFPPAMLMDMMMEQISIARDEPGRGRSIVVRTEESAQIRLGEKLCLHKTEGFRMHRHVAVDENDDFAGAGADAAITRGRRPPGPFLEADNFATVRARDRCRPVVRAVVHP